MRKILSALLTASLLAGCGSNVLAVDTPVISDGEEISLRAAAASDQYNYYGSITYTGVTATAIADNSIVGEVIGGGGAYFCKNYANAFDGKISTYYHGSGEFFEMWVGLRPAVPKVVKSFSIATQDSDGDGISDRRHAMWGSRLQGSDEGKVWEDIYVYEYIDFEDYANDTEITYLTIDLPDNERAYRYFRMINDGSGASAFAEIRLFSEKIEEPDVTEPEEFEPGAVFNLTSLPGTTYIKGSEDFVEGALEDIFDGTPSTYADYGVEGGEEFFVGIKLGAPTVLTNVMMWSSDKDGNGKPDKPYYLYGTIVEGSNDGENWEPILQLGDNYMEYEDYAWNFEDGTFDYFSEIPFDGENKHDEDAMEPVPYTYYRIWNNTYGAAVWGDIVLWGYFVDSNPAAPSPITGDISGNCSLDIDDAMLLFQHSMLPEMFPIPYTGSLDFNKDGAVDINDAMLLFRHSMLPELFPIA